MTKQGKLYCTLTFEDGYETKFKADLVSLGELSFGETANNKRMTIVMENIEDVIVIPIENPYKDPLND